MYAISKFGFPFGLVHVYGRSLFKYVLQLGTVGLTGLLMQQTATIYILLYSGMSMSSTNTSNTNHYHDETEMFKKQLEANLFTQGLSSWSCFQIRVCVCRSVRASVCLSIGRNNPVFNFINMYLVIVVVVCVFLLFVIKKKNPM